MLRTTLLIWATLDVAALGQVPAGTRQEAAPGTSSTPVSMTLAAQVMLDRAGFSPGQIDGRAGPNLRRAVTAFQRSRGLRESGDVDTTTAERLEGESGQRPAVVTYALTDADVAGPFQPDIPSDLVEQSKLAALAYGNALEALGEKFHASPELLRSLNTTATFARAGEQVVVPNVVATNYTMDTVAAKPNGKPTPNVRIVVTKHTSTLTVEDDTGRVLFFAPVTTGSSHDPLPIGNWKVTGIEPMPAFHYNPKLFWDADPSQSKATIAPGPNNPVGVAWIDITKEHYGVHGTPEPSAVGHTESHGCVRMTNWDVLRLLAWVTPGTSVIFR